MRLGLALASIVSIALGACAGAPPEPPSIDFDAHSRLIVDGFREANASIATSLPSASAWAVFPDIEDSEEACAHEGRLFVRDKSPQPIVLQCASRPTAPAGVTYHALVILFDPSDVEALSTARLDLSTAPHFSIDDEFSVAGGSPSRLHVTSDRGTLLFAARPLQQSLSMR